MIIATIPLKKHRNDDYIITIDRKWEEWKYLRNPYNGQWVKKGCIEIHDEWIKNARKGNVIEYKKDDVFELDGVEYKVDYKYVKYKENKREKQFANDLNKKYEIEIIMIPKIEEPQGISVPDYKVNGIKCDLKDINENGKNTFQNAIEDNERQAHNFILNINSDKVTKEEAIEKIRKLYEIQKTWFLDETILTKGDEILGVYKRKR